VQFIEFELPKILPNFNLIILDDDLFPNNIHGLTDTLRRTIILPERIYNGAIQGNGRDRFTCGHETAHLLLPLYFEVKFLPCPNDQAFPDYQKPDWQADVFSGALLCPAKIIRGMHVSEVMQKFGVSRKAAEFNLRESGGYVA
jgi:Zn-dependent peptidase ImmA (M78 family)